MALYGHKVSQYSSCGHIFLDGHWADLCALDGSQIEDTLTATSDGEVLTVSTT